MRFPTLIAVLFSALVQLAASPIFAQSYLEISERAWLRDNANTISLVIDNNYPPYVSIDDSGNLGGIWGEFVEHIEHELGITFQIVRRDSFSSALAAAMAHEVDVIPGVVHSRQRAEHLNFSHALFDVEDYFFVRDDFEISPHLIWSDAMIGVVEGYTIVETIRDRHPEVRLVEVGSEVDGLSRVNLGELDVMIADPGVAAVAIHSAGLQRLTMLESAGLGMSSQRFGIRSDYPVFTEILNKTIDRISQKQRNEILDRWIPLRVKSRLDNQLFRNVMFGLLILAIGAIGWIATLRREVRRRTHSLSMLTAELRDRNVELEQRIDENTEMHKKFVASQKREIVGTLAGGVAHDFNNLTGIILANAELLRDFASDEQQIQGLETIIRVSQKAGELSHKMLAFAQQSDLTPVTLNINDVVVKLTGLIKRTIPENIEITASLDPQLWESFADEGSTESALLNLVVNAQHAMPDGGNISIETTNVTLDEADIADNQEHDLTPGRYVCLTVTDTGIGIPNDVIDKIFDPFFTTKSADQGTGLGLSMVFGFMKQTGGAVRVSSECGTGTSFKLFFPVSDTRAGKKSQLTSSKSNSRTGKILLVEDEADLADLLAKHLATAGHIVTTAPSGDEAWNEFAKSITYDLLITDVVMPGKLQGPALAKMIRAKRPNIPVIFISGYTKGKVAELTGDLANEPKLSKPISRGSLLDAVARALSTSNAAGATPEKTD